MTIRSTINATTKTIKSSGMASQTRELCEGSLNGIVPSAKHVMNEVEYAANKTTNPNTTITPVPSDSHWDGSDIT